MTGTPRPSRSRARVGLAAGLALVTLLLAGCSNDPLAEQYREGSDKGYIAGDGTVTEIAEANRQDPVEFTGTDENGDPISSADYAGQVLVLNFWYAGCAPCRAEAPDLEKLNAEYQGTGASFLGVNVRDQAATARSFAETYGVTYPSVVDTDGALQYAFAGTVAPNAVPTTLVIDTEGRVAARILGRVSEPTILDTLIKTSLGVLPEPGATSSPSPTPAAG
ncbi:TlpA family protein disulfide reductase [Herbiconiux gentiana]|uniref:TlpA family protein disulfide reductase n=1 Tax=Herbiconiux gentiana TaxID=2970912 RepID=UPI0035C778FB